MSLELIIGPMFSGKSSALISIIRKHEALGVTCIAYKPNIDNRQGDDEFIYTHDNAKVKAIRTIALMEHLNTNDFTSAKLIIIEEGQFFADLYYFVLTSIETFKKNVIVAGLDGDRFRRPFGQILELIPIADRITKLTSFCKVCGDGTPALFSHGRSTEISAVLVGAAEIYTPLCRKHYLEYDSISNSQCPICGNYLSGAEYRPHCTSCHWDSEN